MRGIMAALALSREAVGATKQGLFWAFGYSIVRLDCSRYWHEACSRSTRARLTLEWTGPFRGERIGNSGYPTEPTTTAEHRAAKAAVQAEYGDLARERLSGTRSKESWR